MSGLEGDTLLPGEGWRPGKGGRRAVGGELDFLERSGGRCLGGEGGLLWTGVSAGSFRGGEEPVLWSGTTTGSSLLCGGGPFLSKGVTTGSWQMLFGFKDQNSARQIIIHYTFMHKTCTDIITKVIRKDGRNS